MIDLITPGDLRRLADTSAEPCVSILMPTHRAGLDQAQDPVRLKNLLKDATDQLIDLGLRAPEAADLLSPVAELLHDAGFWAHQEAALAIYLSDKAFETYRLADETDEVVVVADGFHLKPLLPALATGARFHLLALSQNQVRLLEGTPTHLTEMALTDIPPSLAHVVRFDDRDQQLHSHGADRVGRGRVTASFHGHGGTTDTSKDDLLRFLRAVDEGVVDVTGQSGRPLVLAGVDYVVAAYRNLTNHPGIVDTAIDGNPEQLSAGELQARAWPIVQAVLDDGRRAAADAFLAGSGPTASAATEVIPAAAAGRVHALFAPADAQLWGTFDEHQSEVVQHDQHEPGDEDLFDVAAIETLMRGGTVYVAPSEEVPGSGPLAAILRY